MKSLKMTTLNAMNVEVLSSDDVLLVTGGCGGDIVQDFFSETVTRYTDQDGNVSMILDKTRTTRTICPGSYLGNNRAIPA